MSQVSLYQRPISACHHLRKYRLQGRSNKQSLASHPAETPPACLRKTLHQIQWHGRPWKCTSCPPPPALVRQQEHFFCFFLNEWKSHKETVVKGHTQLFGYFSIFQGVHHPKTNVLVLQDLCCQLKVQCQIILAFFYISLEVTIKIFSGPAASSLHSVLCFDWFWNSVWLKKASLVLHKHGSNNVPLLDLDFYINGNEFWEQAIINRLA